MVLLIPTIGILLWIALFVVALVLFVIVWVVGGLIVGLVDLKHWITGRRTAASSKRTAPRVQSKQNAPRSPERAEAQGASDIWPKWNASHRRYMDREKSLWQAQFDALNSRD